MRGLRKLTSPPLNLKFFLKSTRPSLPLKKVLSKTHQSSLTLKGGSTAFPKPLSPQGTGDVPTALLGAQTATLYGWRTIRGLRQQQSCSFLCGMNRMDTLFRMFAACSMLKGCLLDACCLLELLFEGTADKMDGALRNLLILSSYSP